MQLNKRAEQWIHAFSSALAESHGVGDVSRYFSLTDPKETQLRSALLESVEFLSMITCADVDQLSGQVVSVGSSALYTGRKEGGRFSRTVGVDGNEYKLVKTDSCAALTWDLLSIWANAGDENEFSKRCRRSLSRFLRSICCVLALTAKAWPRQPIQWKTPTAKM